MEYKKITKKEDFAMPGFIQSTSTSKYFFNAEFREQFDKQIKREHVHSTKNNKR